MLLGVYLTVKMADMLIRESYVHLADLSVQSVAFSLEILLGVVLPMAILLTDRGRRSLRSLMTASTLVVLGVAFNRMNVFLVAFQPKAATTTYFPAFGEFAVSLRRALAQPVLNARQSGLQHAVFDRLAGF